MSKVKYISYFYLLILLTGTLVPLGHLNNTLNDNYTLHIRWDYLLHCFAYMPMLVLLGLGFLKSTKGANLKQYNSFGFWVAALAVCLLIAASLESLQLIIPYRSFNINDLLANCLGVVIGILLIPLFRKFVSRIIRD